MSLKFMQKAEQRKKEALKVQAEMAIKQINGQDDYQSSDEEDNFVDAKSKFGVKKLKVGERADGKQLDEEKVLKAARLVTGGAESDSSDYEFEKQLPKKESPKPILKKQAAKESKKPQTVVFNADTDLTGFKSKAKQLIKDTDEDQVLKNLFVTQEEDALEEFEKDKDQEIEDLVGSKVQKVDVKQGWGEWAGTGVDNSRHEQRKQRAEEVRSRKIEELKKKR